VDQAGEPFERDQRLAVGAADPQLEPRHGIEHVEVIGLEPIGLAVRIERAAVVAKLALVDEAHLPE